MATKKTTEETTIEDSKGSTKTIAKAESIESRVADIEKRLEKVEKLANDLLISIRMG